MAQQSELIMALDQIEREKGVKKDDVLLMVEGAIVSALRKHISQLDGRRDYEGLIRQWAVTSGAEVGIQYAESFMQIRRPPDNER